MSAQAWPLESTVTPREPDHPDQLTVPRAIRAALWLPEYDDKPSVVRDDRVVNEALACACGRPAGADGQCTPCRREYAGDTIGNHGGRL